MTELLLKLWDANKPMTAVGLALIPLFFASVAGIFLDPRTITGVPAWLKPSKFAISVAIYLLTMSWVYTYLTIWQPFLNIIGWITALCMVAEIVIIDIQAFRGTTSHYNAATPLDATLFSIMGSAIGILWVGSVLITLALFVQNFDQPIIAAALRCGMVLTVLGSASGVLMVSGPDKSRPNIIGAHTVGEPDGGPGLPAVGWSKTAGDLRVPHFLGLHGIQIIPLLAWLLLQWKFPEARIIRNLYAASASYLTLYGLLLWQAFRAEPLVAPSAKSVLAFGIWLFLTAVGLFA